MINGGHCELIYTATGDENPRITSANKQSTSGNTQYCVPSWKEMVAYVITDGQSFVDIYSDAHTGAFSVDLYYVEEHIRTCTVTMKTADPKAAYIRANVDSIEATAWTEDNFNYIKDFAAKTGTSYTEEEIRLRAIQNYIQSHYTYGAPDYYNCTIGAQILLYAARDMSLPAHYRQSTSLEGNSRLLHARDSYYHMDYLNWYHEVAMITLPDETTPRAFGTTGRV